MENIKVKIGGREIPLRFRMDQFIEIEEEVGNLGEVRELIMKGRNRLRNLVAVIRILGNAGLEESGEDADLTDKWVLRNIEPGMIMVYVIALVAVISEGNKIEAATPAEEQGPVDEGLEEENAKKQPGN